MKWFGFDFHKRNGCYPTEISACITDVICAM